MFLVTALQTDADHEVFLFGDLIGSQKAPHAGGIGRHRLFTKDVLTSADGVIELLGLESRRRGDHHEVGTGIDGLFVTAQAAENLFLNHVHLFAVLTFQVGNGALALFGIHIGHGHQTGVARRVHDLADSASTPAAATHEGHADGIAHRRMRHALDRQLAQDGAGCHRRAGFLKEFAPINGFFSFLVHDYKL